MHYKAKSASQQTVMQRNIEICMFMRNAAVRQIPMIS